LDHWDPLACREPLVTRDLQGRKDHLVSEGTLGLQERSVCLGYLASLDLLEDLVPSDQRVSKDQEDVEDRKVTEERWDFRAEKETKEKREKLEQKVLQVFRDQRANLVLLDPLVRRVGKAHPDCQDLKALQDPKEQQEWQDPKETLALLVHPAPQAPLENFHFCLQTFFTNATSPKAQPGAKGRRKSNPGLRRTVMST